MMPLLSGREQAVESYFKNERRVESLYIDTMNSKIVPEQTNKERVRPEQRVTGQQRDLHKK